MSFLQAKQLKICHFGRFFNLAGYLLIINKIQHKFVKIRVIRG